MQHRPLRSHHLLPLPRLLSEAVDPGHYYEAQLSLIVTGVDEWLWTAYCCVDTYFGAENDWQSYPERADFGYDGPTGGWAWQKYPYWNPREYYLTVLARRMLQATAEWQALVDTFEERLITYVRDSLSDRPRCELED